MGKASRKKKDKRSPVDVVMGLFTSGMCTHCGRNKRCPGEVWCSVCKLNGQRRRASRPPRRATRDEVRGMLDAFEKELSP